MHYRQLFNQGLAAAGVLQLQSHEQSSLRCMFRIAMQEHTQWPAGRGSFWRRACHRMKCLASAVVEGERLRWHAVMIIRDSCN
jgi:hypothetical protein